MSAVEAPIEPVRKSVRIARPVEETFRVFVEDFAKWWPVEKFSRTADDQYPEGVTLVRIVFERRAGGRIYEVTSAGDEGSWAEVLVYDPPRQLVLAWKPNDRPEPTTEVDVRFEPDGDGTVVILEHRGWERLGERAVQARDGYAQGWTIPLQRFEAAAGG